MSEALSPKRKKDENSRRTKTAFGFGDDDGWPGDEPPPRKKSPPEKRDRSKSGRLQDALASSGKPAKRFRAPFSASPTPGPNWGPLLGGLFTGVGFPFLSLSLIAPDRTGLIGQWLEAVLYRSFGVASLLLPFGMLGWGMRLLLPRARRPLQLTWAPALLWMDLLWLSQRVWAQGGTIGARLDGLFVQAVGTAGSSLFAWTCFPLCMMAVMRIHPASLGEAFSAALHWFLDRGEDVMARARQSQVTVNLPLALPTPRSQTPVQLPSFEVENLAELADKRAARSSSQEEAPTVPATGARAPQVLDSADVEPGALQFGAIPVAPEARTPYPPPPAPVPEPTAFDDEFASEDSEPTALDLAHTEGNTDREEPAMHDHHDNLSFDSFDENYDEHEHDPDDLTEPDVPSPTAAPIMPQSSSAEREVPKPELPEPGPETEQEVELPEPEPAPPALRLADPPRRLCEEGVLEDPDGQLRLFPGPAPAPAVTYKLPPLTLLNEAPVAMARRPVEDKSADLLDALASFGVQASLLAIVRGPTVTRYELQPARGVKVSRFTSLTNDIALALAATAVRIEAPIPGKSAIGIEIPNENTDLVVLKDILQAPKFRKSAGLSIALGKDLGGNPTFTNLQKMPHLLVAGTTGSGKSVCVNGLILSLLYRFTPRQLQILMIDPKQVELSIYEGIPHLIGFSGNNGQGSIIVEPKRAAMALHQIVELMELRYGLFASARVRNLEEYNSTAEDPLPWVVVIIDELADLMMVASKTVETSICRIAQKARAAGIHLVLATQRPSADVITGLIKVNIPSRVAFAVSSQVDSRVILDTGGAEQLLGKGDMLFCPVDASDPRRLQGCFVTNEEILRVVEWWKAQGSPENLIELAMGEVAEEAPAEEEGDEDDALVEQALQVVLRRQQASASLLQTELKVGYARARRLVYLMEKKGYIGPAEGSKPRKILYTGG